MKFLQKIWDSLHSKPNQDIIHNEDMQYAGSANALPTPNPWHGVAAPTILIIPESTKDGERLTGRELERLRSKAPILICPDCMEDSLIGGPCGGGSENVYCNNSDCLSRFNTDGCGGWDRISDRSPAKQMVAENKIPAPQEPDKGFLLEGSL